MRYMTKAAALIAVVACAAVSASSQGTKSPSARVIALNYALLHEFAYVASADFDLAGESTDLLAPIAVQSRDMVHTCPGTWVTLSESPSESWRCLGRRPIPCSSGITSRRILRAGCGR